MHVFTPPPTLEMFSCVPLHATLTVKSCIARRKVALQQVKAEDRTAARAFGLVSKERCAVCLVGTVHAQGERPTAWEDGAPVVRKGGVCD